MHLEQDFGKPSSDEIDLSSIQDNDLLKDIYEFQKTKGYLTLDFDKKSLEDIMQRASAMMLQEKHALKNKLGGEIE